MKFTSSILLISAAIASVATAAPLAGQATGTVNVPNTVQGNTNAYFASTPLTKRACDDCTHKDGAALDVIIKASADHYANIAHARLDNLMREISTAKVTSGTEELPKEKALLTFAVQSKIEDAKKACTSEELVPAIKAAVAADANLDVAWSKQEDKELEKKMAALDVKISKLVLDRIQANVNAELLSKDCTEKMTNTEIAPAPESPAPTPESPASTPESPASTTEAPASAPETPAPAPASPAPVTETPAPVSESTAPVPETPAPAPETPAPVPANTDENNNGGLKVGIDVAANVDPKFVCKSGCHDSQDAKNVLSLRVNLENEFKPRLDHFYAEEVPSAYEEKRRTLLDGVLNLLSGLRVNVKADVHANNK
ncbi:hypothetical protein BGZ97_011069 [Linnemannia gamsii]|jgi:hypothetical protein|uniref:Uncharacterized protein n=1 Tax=Linnemannia gamsii TaxID=64522 RepID=A0A9P6R9F0_9FUNG|nr:hypothetical protein BGZ97_011069 [Linnemannia gamsii]